MIDRHGCRAESGGSNSTLPVSLGGKIQVDLLCGEEAVSLGRVPYSIFLAVIPRSVPVLILILDARRTSGLWERTLTVVNNASKDTLAEGSETSQISFHSWLDHVLQMRIQWMRQVFEVVLLVFRCGRNT